MKPDWTGGPQSRSALPPGLANTSTHSEDTQSKQGKAPSLLKRGVSDSVELMGNDLKNAFKENNDTPLDKKTDEKIDKKVEKKINQLNEKIDKIEEKIESKKEENSHKLEKKLDKLETKIDKLDQRTDESQGEENTSSQIESLKSDIAAVKSDAGLTEKTDTEESSTPTETSAGKTIAVVNSVTPQSNSNEGTSTEAASSVTTASAITIPLTPSAVNPAVPFPNEGVALASQYLVQAGADPLASPFISGISPIQKFDSQVVGVLNTLGMSGTGLLSSVLQSL